MPLAEATALVFSAPLLVTLMSPWALGEPVGWRRRSAIAVGFLGVPIILRPGTDFLQWAALLRSIRVHGQGSVQYAVERVGLNTRLDSLQAAVLLGKLPAFEGEIAASNRLADRYDAGLGDVVQTPARFEGCLSNWAQYSALAGNRDGLRTRLGESGIPAPVYYPEPMHLQPAYRAWGEGEGSLPVSEGLYGQILSLPMHAYMRDDTADRIIEAVRVAVA